MSQRVWITGICGFLGSWLRDALIAEGHEVYGNDSLICGDITNIENRVDKTAGANMALIDCRSYSRMKQAFDKWKPDVLVHCAATAHEGLSVFSPAFITKNIFDASVSTFSAAIASGVKRIVNMSSMSRYGAGEPMPPPFHEYYTPAPVDPYGLSKVAAEQTLKMLCETHDVKWTTAVPHNILGPRQRSCDPFRNVAAIMINRCKQGKAPIVYGDGSQKRCFSPVKDCIPTLVKLVHGEGDGGIFNIGPDKGEITILELARKIMKLTGFEGDPIHMPGRPTEVHDAYCSSDKARSLLGYKEQQSLDDCLKEMVDYIQPREFIYDFPIEILTAKTPRTWVEKLI